MIALLYLGVGNPSIWVVLEETRAIWWDGELAVASEEVEELAPAGVEEVAIEVRHHFMAVLHHGIHT